MTRTPRLQGTIRLRGDKSLSHRGIMFGSLADGTSRIRNLSSGEDVLTTVSLLRNLGVDCKCDNDEWIIRSRGFHQLKNSQQKLYCGNSGTTLRLSMGILAGSKNVCELSGDESLNRRPVKRVMNPLQQMGADIAAVNGGDSPPVLIRGTQLHGIDYTSSIASAQVKSAVLLAGLHAAGPTRYTEPTRSRDHTELFLQSQGVDIVISGNAITLSPGREIAPFEYSVPGDISTASFFMIATSLCKKSEISIVNVLLNKTRSGIIEILRNMGGNIGLENERVMCGELFGDVVVRSSTLVGIDTLSIATAHFIDEIPILAVAAMCADGTTTFRNIDELRVKESDRALGIVNMLACYGCRASLTDHELIIEGGFRERTSTPHHCHDHRLAMAIEVADLIIQGEMTRKYQDVINISAPEFYQTMDTISK